MAVGRISHMGFKDLKELKKAGVIKEPTEQKFTPVPMFLPTDTQGRSVANVITRESFILTNLGMWLQWRVFRVAAVILGIASVLLLAYNFIIATVVGALAGWCYGMFIWRNFYVTRLLGRRRLLEST